MSTSDIEVNNCIILLISENSEALQGWNPMEEDFFSVRNSYNIDVDDVGVATTGYSKLSDTLVQ